MKYENISDVDLRELVEKEGVRTLISPWYDEELDEDWDSELRSRFTRGDENERLFVTSDKASDSGGQIAEACYLNVGFLAKVAYEHRRYADAEGFSDAEMDVLRAVEFTEATRVGVDEVIDHPQTEDIAESTVYKYLRRLCEKGLVEKVRPGVYRYEGPS